MSNNLTAHGGTTGTLNFAKKKTDDGYSNLIVAIYKQALEDIYLHNLHAGSAILFLQKNPYGLNLDFNTIITQMNDIKPEVLEKKTKKND